MKFVSTAAPLGPLGSQAGKFKTKTNFVCCTQGLRNLKAPVKEFGWQACRVSMWMIGWLTQAKTCFKRVSMTPSTAPRDPPTLQGFPALFAWSACQISGQGCSGRVRVAGVNSTEKQAKPRGSRPMRQALPKSKSKKDAFMTHH
eukprot:1105381-Pelagomonas_calceolata.AAC.1